MKKKFQISILAESSEKVGFGHLFRSRIISKEFKKLGHKVNFYTIGDKIKKNQTSNKEIYLANIQQIKTLSDCFIIDIFNNLKKREINFIKAKTTKIISFNDVNKNINYFNNALINSTINNINKLKSKNFFGTKYLIISKKFFNNKYKSKKYIFLCVGGSDPLNQLPKIINWIRTYNKIIPIKVAIIKPNKHLLKLKFKKNIKIIINPKKIQKIMGECSFAVCSGGTILTELLSLKKKCLCISLSKSQRDNIKLFSKFNNLIYAGYYKKIKKKKFIKFLKKIDIDKKKLIEKKIPTKFGAQTLVLDIINWLITEEKKNTIKIFNSKEIKYEYDKSAHRKFKHDRLHWGSNTSMNNRYNFIKKIINFNNVNRWLDIGSGDGSLQKVILEEFRDIKCEGIEISKRLFNMSKNKKINNTNFINKDFSKFNGKKKYDLITCHGVLSKTNFSFETFIKKCGKFLYKNGQVLFDLTNNNWNKFNKPFFFRELSHNWFNNSDIIKKIRQHKLFKISNIIGFDNINNKQVKIQNTHAIFYHLIKK